MYETRAPSGRFDAHTRVQRQVILRVFPEDLRNSLRAGVRGTGGVPDVQIFRDEEQPHPAFFPASNERVVVQINGEDGQRYPGSLVDLPCPVETHRTFDRSTTFKSADIAQVVVVYPDEYSRLRAEVEARPKKGKPFYGHRAGLTPPSADVGRKRYDKTRGKLHKFGRHKVEKYETELLKFFTEETRSTRGGGKSTENNNNGGYGRGRSGGVSKASMSSGADDGMAKLAGSVSARGSSRISAPMMVGAHEVPQDAIVLADEEDVVEFQEYMWSRDCPRGVTVRDKDNLAFTHPEIFLRTPRGSPRPHAPVLPTSAPPSRQETTSRRKPPSTHATGATSKHPNTKPHQHGGRHPFSSSSSSSTFQQPQAVASSKPQAQAATTMTLLEPSLEATSAALPSLSAPSSSALPLPPGPSTSVVGFSEEDLARANTDQLESLLAGGNDDDLVDMFDLESDDTILNFDPAPPPPPTTTGGLSTGAVVIAAGPPPSHLTSSQASDDLETTTLPPPPPVAAPSSSTSQPERTPATQVRDVENDDIYRELSGCLLKAQEAEQAALAKARDVKGTHERANPIMKKRLEAGVRDADAAVSKAKEAVAEASLKLKQRREEILQEP